MYAEALKENYLPHRTLSGISTRRRFLGLCIDTGIKDWEYDLVREHCDLSPAELHRKYLPNRPASTIGIMMGKLGLREFKTLNPWTPDEDKLLIDNQELTPKELHEKYFQNRSLPNIKYRRGVLGLTSNNTLKPVEISIIKDTIGMDTKEVWEKYFKDTGRSLESVMRFRRKICGRKVQPYTEEEIEVIKTSQDLSIEDLYRKLPNHSEVSIKSAVKKLKRRGFLDKEAYVVLNRFMDEDFEIFKLTYPLVGTRVPALLNRFSSGTLTSKASAIEVKYKPKTTLTDVDKKFRAILIEDFTLYSNRFTVGSIFDLPKITPTPVSEILGFSTNYAARVIKCLRIRKIVTKEEFAAWLDRVTSYEYLREVWEATRKSSDS